MPELLRNTRSVMRSVIAFAGRVRTDSSSAAIGSYSAVPRRSEPSKWTVLAASSYHTR
jgi:hypothetical protein